MIIENYFDGEFIIIWHEAHLFSYLFAHSLVDEYAIRAAVRLGLSLILDDVVDPRFGHSCGW